MNKMEKILMDTFPRIWAFILWLFSGSILILDRILNMIEDLGELIIIILGVLSGLFLVMSSYWKYRKCKAECRKAEKENEKY